MTKRWNKIPNDMWHFGHVVLKKSQTKLSKLRPRRLFQPLQWLIQLTDKASLPMSNVHKRLLHIIFLRDLYAKDVFDVKLMKRQGKDNNHWENRCQKKWSWPLERRYGQFCHQLSFQQVDSVIMRAFDHENSPITQYKLP